MTLPCFSTTRRPRTDRVRAVLLLAPLLASCSEKPIDVPPATPDLALTWSQGCGSGAIDGDETDIDCGGPSCRPCADGGRCVAPRDCDSGFCVGGTCRRASCSNGVRDGQESDVDCGGTECAGCADGRMCAVPLDCLTRLCTDGLCVGAPPTCMDGAQNADETDVDCGGGRCPPCVVGRTCKMASDCQTQSCTAGRCATRKPVMFAMTEGASYATGQKPRSIAAADFNGDRIADLAVANAGSGDLRILLGKGDGTFTPAGSIDRIGTNPWHVVSSDLNGDGKLDLLCAAAGIPNQDAGGIVSALGKGDGTFAAPSRLVSARNPTSIAAGDLNRDGHQDLVAIGRSMALEVSLGRGDGTFTVGATHELMGSNDAHVLLGDVNGDGRLDAMATFSAIDGALHVLLNRNGALDPPVRQALGAWPGMLVRGDFNRDGKLDLAIAHKGGGWGTAVYPGNGDGSFRMPTRLSNASESRSIAVTADFNLDGFGDLAVGVREEEGGGQLQVLFYFGRGDGSFSGETVVSTKQSAGFLVVGDWNRDGLPDLAAAYESANAVSLLMNTSR